MMHQLIILVFVFTLPSLIFCCKKNQPCPPGFWEVPEGYKCIGSTDKLIECAKNHKCMNYAWLCNGIQDLIYENDEIKYGYDKLGKFGLVSNLSYSDGTPDENICTDEFCGSLLDGRTHRCPGTTRCIPPTKHYFHGTDIPIGPICSEVNPFVKTRFEEEKSQCNY